MARIKQRNATTSSHLAARAGGSAASTSARPPTLLLHGCRRFRIAGQLVTKMKTMRERCRATSEQKSWQQGRLFAEGGPWLGGCSPRATFGGDEDHLQPLALAGLRHTNSGHRAGSCAPWGGGGGGEQQAGPAREQRCRRCWQGQLGSARTNGAGTFPTVRGPAPATALALAEGRKS